VTQVWPIARELDVFDARRALRELALEAGFDRRAAAEWTIVVSELSTNILKYGICGELRVERLDDPLRGRGLRVTAYDVGPPFRDLAAALEDGSDDVGPIDPAQLAKRGGIGAGLGAVVRLTDEFSLESEPVGKRIVVTRYCKRPSRRG
jgi:anti-sigma regulatory factor (Ser/Thr protein kinase)